MANNRMYIRCKQCGSIIFLAKCYLDGYYTNSIDSDDRLNEFFDEHAFCGKPINERAIESIDTPFKQEDDYYHRFEICYEIDGRGK